MMTGRWMCSVVLASSLSRIRGCYLFIFDPCSQRIRNVQISALATVPSHQRTTLHLVCQRQQPRSQTTQEAISYNRRRLHSSSCCLSSTDENSFQVLVRNSEEEGSSNDFSSRRVSQGEASSDDCDLLVRRKEALHASLAQRRIDVAEIEASLLKSINDPSSGYDNRFGKSALKCYRSFLFPKAAQPRSPGAKYPRAPRPSLASAARSCAQQIDFLLQRHRAHQEEWVRHHDTPPSRVATPTPQRTTFPIVLVLDNVRSAFNVGSMFRTADATGCKLVVTTGFTPHPGGSGNDKVRKTSLGSERIVPSLHFETVYDALDHLRGSAPFADFEVVALETTRNSVPYSRHAFNRGKGVILILGNEVTGVRPDVLLDNVDQVLEIPMYGSKNSLNVAACAPVVLFEILRQWNLEESPGTAAGSTSEDESGPAASPLDGTYKNQ